MRHANVAVFIPHVGCPNRCSFCDQRKIAGTAEAPGPEDVRRICMKAAETLAGIKTEAELAFFGGSFTAIDKSYMVALLKAAKPFLGSLFSGIRVSTRPDAIDEEVLELLADYGVTAIELGAQSMRDSILTCNGRGHTAKQVEKAAGLVRQYGFSLGLQMMTGLWGDDDDGALYTAKRFIALRPDTVRIYPVAVLAGTRLEDLWRAGCYSPPDSETAAALCARLILSFERLGIRVIRVGLHASKTLDSQVVAGAYHPAFRELCESHIYWEMLWNAVEKQQLALGDLVIRVAPGCLSRAVGHKRCNAQRLERMGYHPHFREDPMLMGRGLIAAQFP